MKKISITVEYSCCRPSSSTSCVVVPPTLVDTPPDETPPVVDPPVIDPPEGDCIPMETFGAVGDGVTDNYTAFQAAAAYASATPNTTICFDGEYYIAQYRTINDDPINHIYWRNCIGLRLLGSPATIISMNGDFFRPLDYTTPVSGAKKSYTSGLCPFWFWYCDGVEIRDMEVRGNVQDTTRAPGIDINNPSVTESSSVMLRFTKCNNVLVEDMFLHHAESDGILISGDMVNGVWTNSANFEFNRVLSHNNGRQGMSVGGLSEGIFTDCEFAHSGFTEGTYGFNDPAAGIDIEPGANHNCDNIVFNTCYMGGNYGSHFICSYPATTRNISILGCTLETSVETPRPQGITTLAKNVIIDGCTIKLGSRIMKFNNASTPGSTVILRNCPLIEGSDCVVSSSSTSGLDSLLMQNNQFNYTLNTMNKNFINMQMKKLQFLGNDIFIPSAALLSRPKGNHCAIQKAISSIGNDFHSENPLVDVRVIYTGTTTVNDL